MYQVPSHPSASTGIKLNTTYPAIRPATVDRPAGRAAVPATRLGPSGHVETVRLAGKITAASLIVAFLTVGIVGLSLGLVSEGATGVGPDHPPRPLVTPAPAPPPQLPAVSPRPEPAGE
jgi:hypothetical protein